MVGKLLEREHNPYWIPIAPVPIRFKGQSNVPDGTPGIVVGIDPVIKNAVVVRAEYPVRGNDVWAISIDHIEEVKKQS